MYAEDADAVDASFPRRISLPPSEKRFHVRKNDADDVDASAILTLNDNLRNTPFR